LAFREVDAVLFEPRHEFLEAVTVEAEVIDAAGVSLFAGLAGVLVSTGLGGFEIRVLVVGMIALANVHDILVADVQPVDGEPEFGVVARTEAERLYPPVPGSFWLVGEDQEVFHEAKAHRRRLLEAVWALGLRPLVTHRSPGCAPVRWRGERLRMLGKSGGARRKLCSPNKKMTPVALLAGFALLLAGCGDDDGDTGAAPHG